VIPTALAMMPAREFFIDNLLVRIHFIIVMIRWTGLAQVIPTALAMMPAPVLMSFLFFIILDNLLVRIHFIIVMIRWTGQ